MLYCNQKQPLFMLKNKHTCILRVYFFVRINKSFINYDTELSLLLKRIVVLLYVFISMPTRWHNELLRMSTRSDRTKN